MRLLKYWWINRIVDKRYLTVIFIKTLGLEINDNSCKYVLFAFADNVYTSNNKYNKQYKINAKIWKTMTIFLL